MQKLRQIWLHWFPPIPLSPLHNWGLLILRVGIGLLMIPHGWGKLMRFSELSVKFADPIGVGPFFSLILAIFAELFCSIALILGLGTRLACIPLMITALVIALIVHGDDPVSKKELILLYFSGYFSLALLGPGRFSLDHVLARIWPQNAPEAHVES